MIKRVHHFGIRVEDLDNQIKLYEQLGYKLKHRFTIDAIACKAAMLLKDGTGVELFEFPDTDDEFAQKIQKHSALQTDDVEEDIQKFLDNGYEMALPIAQGRIMKKFAYIKDKMGNYIELCEPSWED